jgi:hypothetical protein
MLKIKNKFNRVWMVFIMLKQKSRPHGSEHGYDSEEGICSMELET